MISLLNIEFNFVGEDSGKITPRVIFMFVDFDLRVAFSSFTVDVSFLLPFRFVRLTDGRCLLLSVLLVRLFVSRVFDFELMKA